MPELQDPTPPADDEVERRLAALKAGVDPGSRGLADEQAPPPPPRPPAARAPGQPRGGVRSGSGPAVSGEVIEDGRGWPGRSGGEGRAAGPTPRTGGRPGGTAARPRGPGVRAVAWSVGEARAGRLGLWIGIGLVAFGGYLVLAEFLPGIALLGSVALAAMGVVLVGWNVSGRAGTWALYAGAVLAGFGAARVVADVVGARSPGWGTLGAGLGFLAIAVLRAVRGRGLGWQAWVGGALAIWGGWGVLGATIPGFPTLGDLIVPLVLVLIGLAFVRRGARPAA